MLTFFRFVCIYNNLSHSLNKGIKVNEKYNALVVLLLKLEGLQLLCKDKPTKNKTIHPLVKADLSKEVAGVLASIKIISEAFDLNEQFLLKDLTQAYGKIKHDLAEKSKKG